MNSHLFISAILALIVLSSGQRSCSPGTFRDGRFCNSCPRGQFQPLANQDSCDDCPDGMVATGFGNTECTECPEFSTPNRRRSRCICEEGRTLRRGGSCELCEPGTSFFSGFRGRSFCDDCQPGTFQPDAGQSECLDCPSGTTSGVRATECIVCGDDEFANNRGRCATCPPGRSLDFGSTCRPCGMNTFKAERGLGPCLPCPVGQFSLRGASQCEGCPGNSTLLSNGRCLSCPPGSSLDSRRNTCRLCPINTFMPYENVERSCFRCTGPKFSMEGAAECTRCPQNTGLLQDGTCAECPEGSIYNQRIFRCEECRVNQFTRGDMGFCDSCPSGSFSRPGSSTCFECPRGEAFIAARDACGTCPPGREYLTFSARCRRCFDDSIKPDAGIGFCEFCDSGRANDDRTECLE